MRLTSEALASGPCVRGTAWSQSCCPLMLRELVRGLWVTIRTSCAQSSISRCKSSGRLFSLALMDVPVYVPVLLLLLLACAWARPITGWWAGGVAPVGGCCDWLKGPGPAPDPERTHTRTVTPCLLSYKLPWFWIHSFVLRHNYTYCGHALCRDTVASALTLWGKEVCKRIITHISW